MKIKDVIMGLEEAFQAYEVRYIKDGDREARTKLA